VKFVFFAAKERSKKDKKKLTLPLSFEIFKSHTVTIKLKMRTKTLLIAAAALAASYFTSQAQTVYSANIVGYVNTAMPAGQFVLCCNPLDDGTNTTASIGAALPNKSAIEVWNGAGFTTCNKAGGVWTPNLPLPPGTGFFVLAKTSITNTFVGNVAVPVGGSTTNSLPAGAFVLAGGTIPFSGDLNDTNVNLGTTLANKSAIEVWNGAGFTTCNKAGGVWTPNVTLSPGEGVFILSKTATNWVQSLTSD
jgi:hypothetical protein